MMLIEAGPIATQHGQQCLPSSPACACNTVLSPAAYGSNAVDDCINPCSSLVECQTCVHDSRLQHFMIAQALIRLRVYDVHSSAV